MQLLQDQRQQQQAGSAPQLATQQLQEQSQPPSSQEQPGSQEAEAPAAVLSLADETAAPARADGSAE